MKLTKLLLALVLCASLVGCSQKDKTPATIGTTLQESFKKEAENKDTTEIAEALLNNKVIDFMGATMEVEPGLLNGFDNEILGFTKGTMFAPMIGSIPFIGYVFEVDGDIDGFMNQLKQSANLRWNVCTQAEEMIVDKVGNKVIFVMCPASFEQN